MNGSLSKPHPLKNFEIKRYNRMEPRFNGVYSRNNLPKKIKDGAYVINLDEYAGVGTHWLALFCKRNEIVHFDSFRIEYIPAEIKEFIGNKNIKANVLQVKANNSIICVTFAFYSLILCSQVTN